VLDASILTEVLGAYVKGASEGFPIIKDYALGVFNKLLIIEIVLFGIGVALGKIDFKTEIVAKVVAIGFVQFLLFRYVWLIDVMRDGFLSAGLAAANNNLSIPEFLDPSSYISSGFEQVSSIVGERFDHGLWTYLSSPGAVWFLYGVALLVMFIAYVGIGLLIFLVVVEFYLISSLAIILLPFLIIQKTSFLGMRAINSLVSICLKLMVIAFIAGLSVPVLELLAIKSDEPTIKEAMSLAIGALAIALIMWKAPSIALSMITGSGGLDVNGAIVQPVISAISMASGPMAKIGSLSSSAVNSVGKAASEGVRHARSIINK
jgi:P-type conjugative transfer protein TrbL